MSLVVWYCIVDEDIDHIVKPPRYLVLEEMCLHCVVPTLNEIVGVNPSICNIPAVTKHPSPSNCWMPKVLVIHVLHEVWCNECPLCCECLYHGICSFTTP